MNLNLRKEGQEGPPDKIFSFTLGINIEGDFEEERYDISDEEFPTELLGLIGHTVDVFDGDLSEYDFYKSSRSGWDHTLWVSADFFSTTMIQNPASKALSAIASIRGHIERNNLEAWISQFETELRGMEYAVVRSPFNKFWTSIPGIATPVPDWLAGFIEEDEDDYTPEIDTEMVED